MDRIVIWGIGDDYEKLINQFVFEEYKGNIVIKALVSKKDLIYAQQRDGYPLIIKEQLKDIDFDFLAVCSKKFYVEIVQEAIELGISRNRIINGQVFAMPLFDYKRYISLVKNPVSILSNDCWGGYVYHSLCLDFSSPTINTYMSPDSFVKFAEDPFYYLNCPLEMFREGNIRNNQVPIGKIGDKSKEIFINFGCEYSYSEAEKTWNRRKKRINWDRIFVKLSLSGADEDCDKYLHAFDKVPFPKLCFSSVETNIENVLFLKRFEWYVVNQAGPARKLDYDDYACKLNYLYKDVDILKLLNGEKFLRETI